MKIHIIQPTHFKGPFSKNLFKTKAHALVPLTLPYLGALVPEGNEIRLTDEQVEGLNFNEPCDCALITSTILTSFRAYEIADRFREIGIPVVIGGPHCTFAGNRSRTMELMERLIPLKIRWSTLWNTYRCLDMEFMELAQRSGLLHINMGVESINRHALENMKKKTIPAESLSEVSAILRRMGISFSFNLICGWDTDSLEDFDVTLDFLIKNKVHVAFFNVFSPHKGTKIYDRCGDPQY